MKFSIALNLIKQSKKFIYLSLIIFSAMFFMGTIKNDILGFQDAIISTILASLPDTFLETAIFIILHNIFSNAIALFGGVTVIIPFLSVSFNGYFIGSIISQKSAIIGSQAYLLLIPHGVFEIPAFILSTAFGIRIASGITSKKLIKQYFKDALKVFLHIIVPLLIIAGIIETTLLYFLGSSLQSLV